MRSGAARKEPNSSRTADPRSQPPASSCRELNQQLDSIRKRNEALVKRSHAAVGFQTRSGESRKERTKKSPGGFGVEHPPRLRHTLALADVSTFLSRSFASVGHMGAPICPSASPKASRHLTEARNKVGEVLLPSNWPLRGSSHSLQNRFPQRRRSVCLPVRVRACACPLISRLSFIYNHVSYPTSARNSNSISSNERSILTLSPSLS